MRFAELKSRWEWKTIHGCPGRYVLSGAGKTLSPEDLLEREVKPSEFHVSRAKDTVVVTRLEDGGLISYRKADGTYLHTLNTPEGFERKLSQLEISL